MLKVRRLFESGAYFNYGESTEGSIENSKLCNKKDKYVHLELLYKPSFKSFPTLKREKLTSWSWSYQATWFSYLFISSAITKVGRLFVNTQISTAALIKLFLVKVWCLFESSAYMSSGKKTSAWVSPPFLVILMHRHKDGNKLGLK